MWIFFRNVCRATWPVMSCDRMLVAQCGRLVRRCENLQLGSLGLMRDIHCVHGESCQSFPQSGVMDLVLAALRAVMLNGRGLCRSFGRWSGGPGMLAVA